MKIKKQTWKFYLNHLRLVKKNHLKLAVDQRKFVTFKVFSNVIVWQDSVHITAT